MRRDSGGASVAVMRRSDVRGEREAGLPSWALSIIHDPTLGRARRAEVTGRDKDGGNGVSGFLDSWKISQRGTNENRERYIFLSVCVCVCAHVTSCCQKPIA